jgi:lantibiotic transport system ATP-binding protein
LKFEGKPEDLQSRSKPMILVEVDRPERAHELIAGLGLAVTRERNRMWIAQDDQYESARINTILVNAGIAVSHLATQSLTLEDLFLELTSSASPEKEYASR